MFKKAIKAVEGISWITIGCIICILALRFNLGSLHEPGPGFLAFLCAIFLCGIGIVMVLSKVFSKSQAASRPDAVQPFHVPWRQLTYTVGLLFGYILVFEVLGYILTTFLLLYGLFYNWEKKSLGSSFLFSGLTVLITYVVFEVWLHCLLPRGVFP